MVAYELWVHRWTRQIFAVRLEDGRVTGVCGPLPLSQVAPALGLALLPYDEGPAAVYRAQEHPEQFIMAIPWLEGRSVPVKAKSPLIVRALERLAARQRTRRGE